MEQIGESSINCRWSTGNNHKKPKEKFGEPGNQKKKRDSPENGIAKNNSNKEKNAVVVRKFFLT